uniref:GST N-terminal domain-containing protein n=1 Tax=Psilocybe cubensis TaxID=181762 RepID=A0A8H7XW10_PSICU
MSNENVIVYRYDTSPYSQKIDHVLALKNIPHEHVDVSMMLPRPEIADQLGINYRRIPILAIGNDVYCDTGHRLHWKGASPRQPHKAQFILAPNIARVKKVQLKEPGGLVTAFSKFYTDNVLFPLIVSVLPWEASPPAFIEDRAKVHPPPAHLTSVNN